MSDLVRRLRALGDKATKWDGTWIACHDAADRIEQLEEENARLRDALRLEEEARRTRAQRWTGPEPAIDSDPWAV